MQTIELITPSTIPTTEVTIPGSKSYTNRALIMAALTKHPVLIKNTLESDDTDAMIDCLNALGLDIIKRQNEIQIVKDISTIENKEYTLHARISGTTIRFITALAAIVPGVKHIIGHEGLNKRPVEVLVEGLKQLGADITYDIHKGYPPLTIHTQHLTNHITRLHGDVSSQYFSALLMIAPNVGGLTIEVEGNQISKPYIDMTIEMMKEWGVTVENHNYKKYVVGPSQSYSLNEYTVEGDYSGAGYFFAIGALLKATITLQNLNPHSAQGDREFVNILAKMGNKIDYGDNYVRIVGRGIRALNVDMEQCPDQAQTLAVLAAFADGKTIMTGVRSLRVKETERVKAVQQELAKMGIKTESPDDDTLIVYGGNPKSASIDTYGDHRMAMSFAVASAKLPSMRIHNPEVVGKTFPTFWKKLETIGIHAKQL